MFVGAAALFARRDDEDESQCSRLYSLDELSKMCEAGRVVVAYKGSLYDVTNFTGHPGGVGRLQMAAGSDLEVTAV